jgi:uncharacterized protein YrrD
MIDYDGAHVVDAEGEDIGTVERTYADGSGNVQFVEVKLGGLFAKHRMVPAEDAELRNRRLHVPYDKGVILSSPDVSDIRDTLDGDVLASVRDYYDGAPTAAGGRSEDTGDGRTDVEPAADESEATAGAVPT